MAKKILIVDDEPDIVQVIKYRLKTAGYAAASAFDGQSALEMLKADRPDLILLDMRLPGMDGMEICRRIKNDEASKAIPVVFLTASQESVKEDTIKAARADAALVKPFSKEELLDTIKKLIG